MAEYRLQETSYPSTFAYHEHRERAPHLEQPWQAVRIYKAVEFVKQVNPASVVDLGCGDGGLLSQLFPLLAWGYDFQPSNEEGWRLRGVSGELRDVFNERPDDLRWGELAVVTEVLEHLDDPHSAVRWVGEHSKYIVASSPDDEHPEPGYDHDCHLWGWDMEGYAKLFTDAGFEVLAHEKVDWSQVILVHKVT